MTDKRAQVENQCRAVAHLAKALADVHGDFATIFMGGHSDAVIEIIGARTASYMEQLGDMLNAMDACDEADEWLTPVFEEAHRLWPREQHDVEVTGWSHDRALTADEVKTIFKMSTEFAAAIATAREQGRAEALADVTDAEVRQGVIDYQAPYAGMLSVYWLSVACVLSRFLASRRRPVAAAGNEEWDRSG